MQFQIILVIFFILLLVTVATAKSALDQLSDVNLRVLATEGNGSQQPEFFRRIVEHRHLFSFTLTFGIHLSIASIAILITSLAFELHAPHFLVIAFAGMVLTVILFRQIIPLLVTQNDPARALLLLRLPLRAIYPVLKVVANPIFTSLRGMQRQEEPPTETRSARNEGNESDESEIQALLDVGEEAGIIEQNEGEMIQSIIRFSDRTAAEVMTPRTNIVAVEAETPVEAVRDLMIESKYSRLPVYRDQVDHIEGTVYVRDLLACWAAPECAKRAIDLARPVFFVPETKPTDELLTEMQKAKVQMAIVIDEYGGLAGLLTLEDLIEEIVGEIEDEDEPEPQGAEAEIVPEHEGGYTVRGNVEIGKIERLFDIELAADDFTTVAGLVITQLGHLPAVGEVLIFRSLRFEIIESDERRVSRLRIQPAAEPIVDGTSPPDAIAANPAE
jgi:magnesium and cobalt transporter